jgi:hypothetical protein
MTRFIRFAVSLGTPLFLVACSQPSTPTGPSSRVSQANGLLGSSSSVAAIQSASLTHGQELIAVIGSGSGVVNVTPTAAVEGSFSAQINVAVHGAPANTAFYIQRAAEIGRPNSADGICQRAAGQSPWGPPAPNFVTFPLPAAGPLVMLQTSEGGSGSVHIDFGAPTILDGTAFDVMFRVVDDLTNPTNELRTGCFTVTVK